MREQNVEDIYELSPMQQGMLFHTLYDPSAAAYFEQMICTLRGELRIEALKSAWQAVIDRHPILRSSFHWLDLDEPLQIVHKQVSPPWSSHDWRGSPRSDHEARLAAFLQADQDAGFQLDKAPLLRFALIQVEDQAHELVFSHHHLLFDGWSTPIILQELVTFYDAYCGGEPLPSAPARPYLEYIAWLRRQDRAKANAVWRERLRGFSAPTPLILDKGTRRPGGCVGATRVYAEEAFRLPADVTGALQSLAERERLTLSNIVQGAWAILLARSSGEPDVVFGATVSGRPAELPGVESIVGLFINTLPVRARADGDELLVPWLKDLQAQHVEREQYAYASLAEVQQMSDVPKGTRLFESLLVVESYPWHRSPTQQRGLSMGNLRSRERTSYPLTVVVKPGAELSGRIAYDTSRFDASTIRRMVGHLRTLLEGMASNPERRIGDLPMLTPAERRQLVIDWNDTKTDYPTDRRIDQRIEAQAAQTPDAVAVVLGDRRKTYGELNAAANRLARYLISLGAGPRTPIAICVERSLDMVVGMLGALKTGGYYVPHDPAYPEERLAFMLKDAGAAIVLTEERLAPLFSKQNVNVFCFDRDSSKTASFSADDLSIDISIDHPAYLIYTSGSTGKPKGVQISHRSLLNVVDWYFRACKLTAGDRVAQLVSFGFDGSIIEFWPCLAEGAELHLVPQDIVMDPPALRDFFVESGITSAFVITPLAEQLVTLSWPPTAALRVLLMGGDTLRAALPRSLPFQLVHVYGPTECTVFTTSYVVSLESDTFPPIGRPISNAQVYIVDKQLQPVPLGAPGELCIAGDGLAPGYHNRPALTAEKFVKNPFGQGALYRSGDLARYSPSGDIEFLGRLDHQVKIRGFRIELGEIEARLGRHPRVRDAAVITQGQGSMEKRLVAYVVPREPAPHEPELRIDELTEFLRIELPDVMVPKAFVFLLKSLPVTSNGKVDRRALPFLDETPRVASAPVIAPRTATEEAVAAVWREVLGVKEVSIHDNFFELGGHSLLATQALSRLREAFVMDLPLRRLFELPTVAQLSEHIVALEVEAKGRGGTRDGGTAVLNPVSRDQAIPLSFAQARLWFLDQLEGESTDYRVPIRLGLAGRLDREALGRAIGAVVERHEALRTTFAVVDGSPVQVIHPALEVPLRVVDLRAAPEAERRIEAERISTIEARRPFDLAAGPLVRATLLIEGDQQHVLLLMMHHIVCDGWSLGILWHELSELYAAFSSGQPSPLPALPIQYGDYAHFQRRTLKGELYQEKLAYWREQLSDAPPLLQLLTDRPRPSVQTFRGGSSVFRLDQALSREILRLGQRAGATLFMTLLTAFAVVLSRYSRQKDIVIGSPVANRGRQEIEALIGCFINTIVIRANLEGDPSFLELLARVRQTALDAFAHQDLPFEKLVDELAPSRSLSHNPIFQVMFAIQNVPTKDLALPGVTVAPMPFENITTHFDLALTMKETDGELSGAWEYSSDLFDAATIDRMSAHLRALLESVVAAPAQPLSSLSMMPAAERRLLLAEWSANPGEYTLDLCAHQRIEEQAERTPDAIAVVDPSSPEGGPRSLTYRELNERSNRLAHHLRSLGVGEAPDTLVGLCIERSLSMIVGLLGILKAGGAFVPLDPAYPTERLAYQMKDAAVRVLVTEQRCPASAIAGSARAVFLDTQWEEIARQSAANPDRAPGLRDLAYTIYTSGSTGDPKGVMMEHRGLASFTEAAIAAYGISARDRVLQFATINFDTSLEEIVPTLVCGATLILRTDEMLSSVPTFVQRLEEWGVTVWSPPTAHWHLACHELTEGGQSLPASLRLVMVGGERLLSERVQQWLRLAGNASLLMNGYGPTEGAVIATVCNLSGLPPEELPRGEVPIGRPVANAEVYVLDEGLQPVPIGVAGELFIGGAGLARGYLNQPEATGEKFVPHPFSATPGARLYKTGDLVRFREDGNLEFLGRVDGQVKIRGFRVELGEIEAVLRRHPEVSEAVVIPWVGPLGDGRTGDAPTGTGPTGLAAYVVPKNPQLTAGELSEFLKQKLPAFMIPRAVMLLSTLPLTKSGKIDRRALPAPSVSPRRAEGELALPRTPIEERLSAIWAEILRQTRVGIFDNFFELGGDSILSIQVVTRARRSGIALSPKQIFQHQTIAELAAAVGAGQKTQAEQGVVTGGAPLTPVQHAFFEMRQRDPHFFNLSLMLETPGDIKPDLLREVVQALVVQHDALRLRFVHDGERWQQRYADIEQGTPFSVIDLSSLAPAEQPAAMMEADRALQGSLSLSAGPIVRVGLVKLGDDRAGRLLLIVHHLAMDIVSWWILIEDLMTAYAQRSRGEAIELPPKTTSYKEWAGRLIEYAQSDALAAEIPYWLATGGGGVRPLPTDYPPCEDNNIFASLDRVSVALPEEETRALLQELPLIYGAQINDVLLTAFAQAVLEWTRERAMLVELANHGREMLFEDADLSRTVGWFVAEYPVVLSLDEAWHPRRSLKLVQEQLGRVPMRGIGYGMLRYLRRDEAMREKLRGLPQAQVTFTYFGQYDQMLQAAPLWGFADDARPSFYSPSTNRDPYLLNVHAVAIKGKMQVNWTYSTKIHRRETVERLAEDMLERLRHLIAYRNQEIEARPSPLGAGPVEDG